MENNEQVEERIKVRILPNLMAILIGSSEKKENIKNINIKRTTMEELEQKIKAIEREQDSTHIKALEDGQTQHIERKNDIRKRTKPEIQSSKRKSQTNTIDNRSMESKEIEER